MNRTGRGGARIALPASLILIFTIAGVRGASKADFARDVQPILHARCAACHGGERPQAGLSVLTLAGLLRGGQSGAAIVQGSSEQSLLIRRVAGLKSPVMPLNGAPLTAAEIEVLKAWIDQGAEWRAQPGEGTPPVSLALDPPKIPAGSPANPIDILLEAYFRNHGITPPPLVSDEVFLRRVYLDLWGLLPTPNERAQFLENRGAGKRERLIDQLLANRKNYAEHWISYWNDLLRNEEGIRYPGSVRKSITPWLLASLQSNLAYDRMVTAMLNPVGKESPDGFLLGVSWGGDESASQSAPMQAAQNSAQVFLGINLKCASCHDSFISRWKLRESYGLAAFFSAQPLDIYRCDVKTGQQATARFLFPELMGDRLAQSLDERRALAAELFVSRQNGRFARTMVNRIWKKLFERGLIEPADDMDGEAWDRDLLEWLAADFVEHRDDLQFLLRRILTSRAYQLPAVRLAEEPRQYTFRGPLYRRLTAEQFVDAISAITGEWGFQDNGEAGKAVYARNWRLQSDRLTRGLGRPIRDQVFTERSRDPTTLQALELVNGGTLSDLLYRGARRMTGELKPSPANLFDSGVRTTGKAAVDVDITGAKQLWLVMTDDGTRDPAATIAGWAEAELLGPSGKARLVDLPAPTGARAGSVQVKGQSGEPAMLVNLPSTAVYDLAGKGYTRFRAAAAVGEVSQKYQINARVRFFVFAEEPDPKQLARVSGDPPVPVMSARLAGNELIGYLYRYAMGRDPAERERQRAKSVLNGTGAEGLEDLLWAMFLSPEFQFIR
jgi:hypothetical protein